MERTHRWITVALVFALLTAGFLFTGCELDASKPYLAESASRSLSPTRGGDSQPFTAVVIVEQKEGYNTEQMGEGDRWRTTEEVLEGKIVYSSWGVLHQKQVAMSNFTNFQFIIEGIIGNEPEPIPFGNISGTNHSSIEIKDDEGELVMAMRANGKLNGYFPAIADLDMTFTSTGPGPNARGELSGKFIWSVTSEEIQEELMKKLGALGEESLPENPFGIFELTGVYR